MRCHRLLVWSLGTCLFAVVGPTCAFAQVSNANPAGGQQGVSNTSGIQTQQVNTVTTTPLQAMSSGAGSATGVPSNANPFAPSYVDPLSVGLPANFSNNLGVSAPKGTFGKAIYTTTGNKGAAAAGTTSSQQVGFNTHGTVRNAAYTTVLSDDVPLILPRSDEIYSRVKAIIDRSNYLPSKGSIQVSMEGMTLVLQGQVATDRERRMAEGMVRTTPGIREVENRLQVVGQK